jgi:hypothetical protein
MAEARILRECYRLRPESWTTPQSEIITANLDWSAESSLEPRRYPSLQTCVANQQRNSNLRKPEENEDQDYPFEPPAPAARRRMNRRERLRCCDALRKCI